MGACAAVSVHNNFATGESAVSLGAADHKAASGVNQIAGVFEPLFGQDGFDNFFDDGVDEFLLHGRAIAHFRAVLARQHHGINAVGLAIHITHGHLALGVGA